ncbi:MAG: hypothetical protein AB7N76_19370 [Planctomycetota bacterium]
MSDRDLRQLEREAAAGDLLAAAELARARARAGFEPPPEIALGEPFPMRLPYPLLYRELLATPDRVPGAPLEPRVLVPERIERLERGWRLKLPDPLLEQAPTLVEDRRNLELLPEVRTPADAFAHLLRTTPLPPRRYAARFPNSDGPAEAPAGEGLRASFARLGLPVHYFIHAERGALLWPGRYLLDLTQARIERERPPQAPPERGGWCLVIDAGAERHQAERALRATCAHIPIPELANLRRLLGGPVFRGERVHLAIVARYLRREHGLDTELLWLEHGAGQPPELPALAPGFWPEVGRAAEPYPELGQVLLSPTTPPA